MTPDRMRKQLVGVRLLALEMTEVIQELRHRAAIEGAYKECSSLLLRIEKLIEPLHRAGKEDA